MDKLYAKLSEQQTLLLQQKEAQRAEDDSRISHCPLERQSTSSSLPITPATATETYPTTGSTTRSASITPNDSTVAPEEVLRLKLELAQAQNKITRLDQELAQTRLVSHSGRVTPALGSEPDFPGPITTSVSPVASRFPAGLGMPAPIKQQQPFGREQSWMIPDDSRSDMADPVSLLGANRSKGIWNTNKPIFSNPFPPIPTTMTEESRVVPWGSSRPGNQPPYESSFAPAVDAYRTDRMPSDHDAMRPAGRRGNRYDSRFGQPSNFSYGNYGMPPSQYETAAPYIGAPSPSMTGTMGMGLYPPYQQQPVGTTLSPHATEFTSGGVPWKTEV